jgi:5-methylcytosine-specific restriction protein A
MYLTPEWQRDLRPAQLLREPFCRECAKRGLRTKATRVDHVVDHKGDWALFSNRANLQSLCESCHNRKTAKEQAKKRRENGQF